MRIVLLCLAISGISVARFPGFIEKNIHTKGDIEAKLNDVITLPLKPEKTNLRDRTHYYMFPPRNATSDGKPRGLLLYLHSCKGTGMEFFTLPEHRIIAHDAIERGMVVFSPTSYDRESGCFTSHDATGYLTKVVSLFVRRNRFQSLPRVGLGHSSGGAFLSYFQKILKLESMALYNSPEDYAEIHSQHDALIPTVFLTMSNDGSISNRMNASMTMLQERKINTNLYRASPKPFTRKVCAARLPEVQSSFCDSIFKKIEQGRAHLLDADGFVLEGDVSSPLWERFFERLEWYDSHQQNKQYKKLKTLWDKEKSWLQVILEEEIKTCYGYHAMTAQFHDEILDFLVSNSNMRKDPSPSLD